MLRAHRRAVTLGQYSFTLVARRVETHVEATTCEPAGPESFQHRRNYVTIDCYTRHQAAAKPISGRDPVVMNFILGVGGSVVRPDAENGGRLVRGRHRRIHNNAEDLNIRTSDK